MEALLLFGIISLVGIKVILYEIFFDKPTIESIPVK